MLGVSNKTNKNFLHISKNCDLKNIFNKFDQSMINQSQ